MLYIILSKSFALKYVEGGDGLLGDIYTDQHREPLALVRDDALHISGAGLGHDHAATALACHTIIYVSTKPLCLTNHAPWLIHIYTVWNSYVLGLKSAMQLGSDRLHRA